MGKGIVLESRAESTRHKVKMAPTGVIENAEKN